LSVYLRDKYLAKEDIQDGSSTIIILKIENITLNKGEKEQVAHVSNNEQLMVMRLYYHPTRRPSPFVI
jgi:hypothetical protein